MQIEYTKKEFEALYEVLCDAIVIYSKLASREGETEYVYNSISEKQNKATGLFLKILTALKE